jgi:hypothetical protein
MFKEFYYYLYEIHTSNKSDKSKFFNSLIGISFLQQINITALWGMINYFSGYILPRDFIVVFSISISVFLGIINYYCLYRKRVEISKKVEGFSTIREKAGKTAFVIYILATLFFMYYVMNNFVTVRY